MNPVGALMVEHRLIERLIADLQRHVEAFRAEARVETEYVDLATDFIRAYADRCHHGKEEDIFFKALESKELDGTLRRLMGELTQEHAWARATTKALVEANLAYRRGDEERLPEVLRRLQQLASFYPGHITKEESRFFKPALAYLDADEQAGMLGHFESFDRSLIHERYRSLVERLEGAQTA